MTSSPVDHESRPMSMRGEGFVEGEPGTNGRALSQFNDFNVKSPQSFFEIIRRKENTFKNKEMAQQILTRAFDHGIVFEQTLTKKVLTKEDIKELEKADEDNTSVHIQIQ